MTETNIKHVYQGNIPCRCGTQIPVSLELEEYKDSGAARELRIHNFVPQKSVCPTCTKEYSAVVHERQDKYIEISSIVRQTIDITSALKIRKE